MIYWKIDSSPTPNRLLETICTKWNPCLRNLSHLRWLEPRLTWVDPTSVASKLALLQGALNTASERHYLSRTRELIEQLVGDSVDKTEEDSFQLLNNMLRPYYENIFFLDNKWKVLESFCRQCQLPWDIAQVRTLRQQDQQYLQALFDERRSRLRSILERNGIRSVDVLHVGVIILQQEILASLEHLQLELCEMLTAVGYFGDSFHYVKHRIPMIQGKNYRNLLAHDALSYNLLTDSGDEKLIVNAYIFAYTEVRLFDGKRKDEIQMKLLRFPSSEDTASWVEEQQQLLGAFKSNDAVQVRKLMCSSVGEIKGLFCRSQDVEHYPATCLPIVYHVQGNAVVEPSISAYLSLYIANYQVLQYDAKFLLKSAIVRRDFEAAAKFLNVAEPFPWKEFYSWSDLMSHPTSKAILTEAALKRNETLEQLLDYGNEKCFVQLVHLWKDLIATEEYQDI
uniref:Uncharacterized protein n=1 Tax=Anopheles maculatus TaxID=74869 RepID=A0A182SSM4_9DIPT